MATKKTTPKKTTAAAKKTTTAVRKKSPAKRKAASKPKVVPMQSFRVYHDPQPFMTFQITKQTLYWLVIAAISISFTAWILKFQSDINEIYTQIEMMQATELVAPAELSPETAPEA